MLAFPYSGGPKHVVRSDVPSSFDAGLSAPPRQSARFIDPTGRVTQAVMRRVAPVVDERTRLGTVRVALPAATRLKPGMFVRVEIDAGSMLALTIPFKALVGREGRVAVFKVSEEGTAILNAVTAGRKTNSSVEVVQGPTPGDRIVEAFGYETLVEMAEEAKSGLPLGSAG